MLSTLIGLTALTGLNFEQLWYCAICLLLALGYDWNDATLTFLYVALIIIDLG